MRIFTFILLSLFSSLALAQDTKDVTGNWLMYFGQNRVSDKWSVHSEIQYRNHEVAPNTIEQLLLRTGMNYHIAPNSMVTAGYGFIASHDYDSEQSNAESTEHRIWQQLILVNKVGKLKFEHRYRVEQRWVNGDYKDRLRYRLMAFLPLNRPEIEEGAVFLGIYNEIFLNTKRTFFDRNRLYGALGYQVKDNLGVQVGLLRQRVNGFGKSHLQFAVIINTDFRSQNTDQ